MTILFMGGIHQSETMNGRAADRRSIAMTTSKITEIIYQRYKHCSQKLLAAPLPAATDIVLQLNTLPVTTLTTTTTERLTDKPKK